MAAVDVAPLDTFARSVAISGSTAVMGVPIADVPAGTDAGAAYVFNLDRYLGELTKLTASDATSSDEFGRSVAISGDTAVIVTENEYNSGRADAYVFIRSGGGWIQQAELTTSDLVGSVAISGDTIVLGTSRLDNPGSAYVFVRAEGIWTQQATLTAADGEAGDGFGCAVAVDGETALVGAFWDDHSGYDAGSAYIFVRSNGVWSEQAKLTASDAAAGDWFGYSVSAFGDTAAIGAYGDDHDGGTGAGAAYVFVRAGGVWAQQSKLVASDAAAGDYFGNSVSVSGDTLVIGSHADDHAGGTDAGAAYVFVRSNGFWSEQAKLTAPDAAAGDMFGHSVAISGERAVIGAPLNDHLGGTDCGSAYFFVRSGGVWTAQGELGFPDAAANDQFGYSVAVSGRTAVIGGPFDTHAGGTGAGSAYVWGLNFPAPGDLDADGDIDFDDYVTFADSLAGPGSLYPPGRGLADLDGDADVDLADFAAFQVLFPG